MHAFGAPGNRWTGTIKLWAKNLPEIWPPFSDLCYRLSYWSHSNSVANMDEKPFPESGLHFFIPDLQNFIPVPQTRQYLIRNKIWAIYAMLRFEIPTIAEKIFTLATYLLE